jgi:hypothetical protein
MATSALQDPSILVHPLEDHGIPKTLILKTPAPIEGGDHAGGRMLDSPTSAPTVLKHVSSGDELVSCLSDTATMSTALDTESLVSSLPSPTVAGEGFSPGSKSHHYLLSVRTWDEQMHYSDLVRDGLDFLGRSSDDVVMLFESPSSCSHGSSFYNDQVFKFHDWPPPKSFHAKTTLGPLRYSLMNGSSLPTYIKDDVPEGLIEHWRAYVPGFVEPTFVRAIQPADTVYAYLPVESIENHVNDPRVHYHLVGKDAIALMTDKTTKNYMTRDQHRPCICKTTHSMGSRGIFVIRNDEDDKNFQAFLEESGHPNYVITELVDIARNVACHFFIHPSGEITWIGSNENIRTADGSFSSDSYIYTSAQDELRTLQLPFVKDVAAYCLSLGFWGFCGVDILFDAAGKGYLVDVNPRVTGSCPAIMMARRFYSQFGFDFALFRRDGSNFFHGPVAELLAQVKEYNEAHSGETTVVLVSYCAVGEDKTAVNIGVYSRVSMDECKQVLNMFSN